MILIMSYSLETLFQNGVPLSLKAGEYLFHSGDPVQSIFFICDGSISLERPLPNGGTISQQTAQQGDVLAEASAYSDTYHCDARCTTSAVVKCLPKKDFLNRLSSDPKLSNMWPKYLARAVQSARLIGEIRSLKTVSERLDAWLLENGTLPQKGHWQTVANELAVSREALYRELKKRHKDAEQ